MMQDETILDVAARDGSIDYSKWPVLLEAILPELDNIVHHTFPIPRIPLPGPAPLNLLGEHYTSAPIPRLSSSPTGSSKEPSPPPQILHTPPPRAQNPPLPDPQTPPLYPTIPDSQPQLQSSKSSSAPPDTLPPQLLSLFTSIGQTLETTFATCPPYTIQRLAELILRPTAHYRTLPSYLRALDRVVSVSSTADTYPLPSVHGERPTDFVINGFLTSDEAESDATVDVPKNDFSGSTLTPISWLQTTNTSFPPTERPLATDLRTESTRAIEGPNGLGSIETVVVEVNGHGGPSLTSSRIPTSSSVTTLSSLNSNAALSTLDSPSTILNSSIETPSTLISSTSPPSTLVPTSPALSTSSISPALSTISTSTIQRQPIPPEPDPVSADDPEPIHARGPEFVGVEDMGPQGPSRGPGGEGRFDMAAAVGRKGEGEMVLVSGGKSEGANGESGLNEGLKGEGGLKGNVGMAEGKGEMEGVEATAVAEPDTEMGGLEGEGERDAEGEIVPAGEDEGAQDGRDNDG